MAKYRWDGTPLALPELDAIASALAKDAPPGTVRFSYTINAEIIRHFLGEEWYRRNAYLDARPTSYLAPRFNDDERAPEYSIKFLLLAEALLNLQGVPGFSACLKHFELDQIESGYAELQVGALLRRAGVTFAYVDPDSGGGTYDLDISLPGGPIFGEIKCKYDRTAYSDGTVRKALREARKPLPPDGDGVVFIKLPQHWLEGEVGNGNTAADVRLPQCIVDATLEALTSTTRIKRVVYYVFNMAYDPLWGMGVTQYVAEIANTRNAPDCRLNGELLGSALLGNWKTIPELNERWSRYG